MAKETRSHSVQLVIPDGFLSHLLAGEEESEYYLQHRFRIPDEDVPNLGYPDLFFMCNTYTRVYKWRYAPNNMAKTNEAIKAVYLLYKNLLPNVVTTKAIDLFHAVPMDERREVEEGIITELLPTSVLLFQTVLPEGGMEQIHRGFTFFHAKHLNPRQAYTITRELALEHIPSIT